MKFAFCTLLVIMYETLSGQQRVENRMDQFLALSSSFGNKILKW